MCRWPQNEGMGNCEFCAHRSGIRSEWKHHRGCFLAASDRRYQTHRAQHYDKESELYMFTAGFQMP